MLSESVAKALRQEGEEFEETAQFIEMFDKFFDILNVSSISEGQKKLKKNCYPFRTSSDDRLTVSINVQ